MRDGGYFNRVADTTRSHRLPCRISDRHLDGSTSGNTAYLVKGSLNFLCTFALRLQGCDKICLFLRPHLNTTAWSDLWRLLTQSCSKRRCELDAFKAQ